MKKFFARFEEHVIVVMLPLMTLLVVASVVGRYTGLFRMNWAEETVRYMYIWLAFLGIGAAAKTDSHFRVGALVESLPPKARLALSSIYNAITIAFLLVLIGISVKLLSRLMAMRQITPILKIPMWVAYLAIPVGCALMILRTVLRIHGERKARKSGDSQREGKEPA